MNAPTCNHYMGSFGIKDVQQNNPHHFGTVFQHTNAVLENLYMLYLSPEKGRQPHPTREELFLAACFHDAAKYITKEVNPETGYSQFLGHAEKSAEIYKRIENENAKHYEEVNKQLHKRNRRSKSFPAFIYPRTLANPGLPIVYHPQTRPALPTNERIEYTSELIRLHDTKYSKEGKIKNMLESHPNGFAADLLKLQLSDVLGQRDVTIAPKLQEIEDFASRILNIGTAEQTIGVEAVLNDVTILKERYTEIAQDAERDSKVFLARTLNGQDIYVSADTMEHMKAHPDVKLAHVVEAIGKINDYDGRFHMGSVDMGRVIGTDNCVEVGKDNEEVQMLYRKGREGKSPVILETGNTKPAETKLVTIGMRRDDDDGKSTMFTSFYGQIAPKEPWDKSLTPKEKVASQKFWSTHALVIPKEAVDLERSELKKVPEGRMKTLEEVLNRSIQRQSPGTLPKIKDLKEKIRTAKPEKNTKDKKPKQHDQAKKKTAPTAPGVR